MVISDLIFEAIENNTFDCYLQQLISLCRFYHGEYYKLLYGEEIFLIKGIVDTHSKYNDNLLEFYGIQLIQNTKENIHPSEERMFIVAIDLHHYPPCNNLSSYDAGEHYIILHGETEEHYVVHDNFFLKKNYFVPKELVREGLISSWEIRCVFDETSLDCTSKGKRLWHCFENYCNSYAIDMYVDLYNQLPKYIDNLDKMEKRLVANIQLVFGFLDRTVNFIEGYLDLASKHKQSHLTDELKMMVRRIMQKWYMLFKKRLKNGYISYDDFCRVFEDIILILNGEKEIKRLLLLLKNHI